MIEPPGNSLDADQHHRVADHGSGLADGLHHLLGRIAEELVYNDSKGTSPYRLGMHDGLRFAQDAVTDLLADASDD